MYFYVVKWPVIRLQRGSAKSPIAPSNFSPLCISLANFFVAFNETKEICSNLVFCVNLGHLSLSFQPYRQS